MRRESWAEPRRVKVVEPLRFFQARFAPVETAVTAVHAS